MLKNLIFATVCMALVTGSLLSGDEKKTSTNQTFKTVEQICLEDAQAKIASMLAGVDDVDKISLCYDLESGTVGTRVCYTTYHKCPEETEQALAFGAQYKNIHPGKTIKFVYQLSDARTIDVIHATHTNKRLACRSIQLPEGSKLLT